MNKGIPLITVIVLFSVFSSLAVEPECDAILKESGISGGLAVTVETWNKDFCKELVTEHPFLLHVLLSDRKEVEKTRKTLVEMGIYGKVTVGEWDGEKLPLVDRCVRLVVSSVSLDKDELHRVLSPLGTAIIKGKTTKAPWPDTIDEWTHFLHGPDNNAVAHDKEAGPPRRTRWMAGPRYLRHHGSLSSMSALVSAKGRLFYIYDHGPTFAHQLQPVWRLEARDAFSGIDLWQREIKAWANHLGPFRHGPTELPRRLVASGDHLFVTLGYGAPVSVLDAATGKTLRELDGTEGTLEIICSGDVLYLVKGKTETWAEARKRGFFPGSYAKSIIAVNWKTGKKKWEKNDTATSLIMPTTLAADDGGRLFFQNKRNLVSLDADTGEENWKTERIFGGYRRGGWGTPTVVVQGDVVICAERHPGKDAAQDKEKMEFISDSNRPKQGDVIAYSVKDGKELWRCVSKENYNSPIDVLIVDGKVWTGDVPIFNNPGFTAARNLVSGEIVKKRGPDSKEIEVGMYHHRCYRVKATDKYLFLSRAGTELLDVNSGTIEAHHWVRGSCQYGMLPCNGLLYATPHACACYIEAKLTGFAALAPGKREKVEEPEERLQKGPAYAQVSTLSPQPSEDWPTYRSDCARSGMARCDIPKKPVERWRVEIPGSKHLSSIVSADDMVFGADVDGNAVFCIDAKKGSLKWIRVVGGPVDSPPGILGSGEDALAIFGCRDGFIYCLRASDGELVWRYRPAEHEEMMVNMQKLESVWPVHGSVLVLDRTVYAVAGRSSYLDGGLRYTALNAMTGDVIAENIVKSGDTETGSQPRKDVHGFYMKGALPDILSSDGESLFMRHYRMDKKGNLVNERVPHIFSPAGFLDDQWWNRTYWIVGEKMGTGYKQWHTVAPLHVRGRILVTDGKDTFYGYRRKMGRGTVSIETQNSYELFKASREDGGIMGSAGKGPREPPVKQPFTHRDNWARTIPVHARGLVLGETLLAIAGRPDPFMTEDGSKSRVLIVGIDDGSDQSSIELPAEPVFDSLIAARGNLYVSMINGEVLCLSN